MNSPADFAALKCSPNQRARISAMLRVWNDSLEHGNFDMSRFTRTMIPGVKPRVSILTVARELGLRRGRVSWRRD